jgi:hypothetical protein
MDVTPDGRTYCERYSVMDYPHVGIVDPRTGRLLWKKEGWTQEHPLTAMAFAEYAMDFCSRHSFDKPPQAPRSGTSTSPRAADSGERKRPFMTEQEQLQAAMAASLKKDSDDDDDVVVMEPGDDTAEVVGEDSKQAAKRKEASVFEQLLEVEVGDEPTGNAARVQLRMSDGKRAVRKFGNASTVRQIYAFVAQSNAEAIQQGKEFTLMAGFPPKDIFDQIDSTVESCQLDGGTINVRWKD